MSVASALAYHGSHLPPEPMPVSAENRLGPYKLLGLVGAGGMGVVYRARDARLGREVAIKRLRGDAALAPDRLPRFEREARLAGSLNHPNVLTVR